MCYFIIVGKTEAHTATNWPLSMKRLRNDFMPEWKIALSYSHAHTLTPSHLKSPKNTKYGCGCLAETWAQFPSWSTRISLRNDMRLEKKLCTNICCNSNAHFVLNLKSATHSLLASEWAPHIGFEMIAVQVHYIHTSTLMGDFMSRCVCVCECSKLWELSATCINVPVRLMSHRKKKGKKLN